MNKMKYVEIPMIVIQDNSISSTAKVVMGLITTLSMKDGFCFASNRYLSNILNVSKRTITSCITSLKDKKYINIKNEINKRKIYLANII